MSTVWVHRRATDERGETSIEHVLLVPAMFLICLLAVQAALWFHAGNVAESAASRAALAGAGRDGTVGAAHAVARHEVAANGGTLVADPRVERSLTAVVVHVEVTVPRLVPFVPASVRRSASAAAERFVPEPQR